MDIKEIVKNAPEGATHYRVIRRLRAEYYKTENGNLKFYCIHDSCWYDSIVINRIRDLEPLPTPPKTRTKYVKVKTFNFADLKDAFDKGELFTGDLGEYRKVVNEVAIPAALCASSLYRRIEKEVDWREEVSEFVRTKAQDSPNCNTFTSVSLNFLTDRSFLEMCRIALRATGEIE